MAKKGEPRPNAKRQYGTFIPDDGKIELEEIDFAVLRELPMVGSKIGKYLPDARTAQQVRMALGDPVLTNSIVAGRLRWLRAGGYAVPVKVMGRHTGAKGWQRTREGQKLLLEKDAKELGGGAE